MNELIQDYERINRKFEKAFMPSIQRAIHQKVLIAVHKVQSGGINEAVHYLHMDIGNPHMAEAVTRLYQVVGMRWASTEYSRMLKENGKKGARVEMITKGFGFSKAWHSFITEYFKRYLLEVVTYDIATTTRDHLLKILFAANAAGWGVDQIVDKMKDLPWETFQAARIVRTEVNRAANVGHKANSEELSYQQNKEWMSAEDHRVRGVSPKDHADHVALNGIKIDADDKFTDPRNGDRLNFPGDVTASAVSTINCRCRALYTAKRDANGELVPKRRSTTVIFPGDFRRPQTIQI